MKKYKVREGKILYVKNTRTLKEEANKIGSSDAQINRQKKSLWIKGSKEPYFTGFIPENIDTKELGAMGKDLFVSDISTNTVKWFKCLHLKDTYFGKEIKEEPPKRVSGINWEAIEYDREREEINNYNRYGTTDKKKIEKIEKEENDNFKFGCLLIILSIVVVILLNLVSTCMGADHNPFEDDTPWLPRHTYMQKPMQNNVNSLMYNNFYS